jgi:hypothetical protein
MGRLPSKPYAQTAIGSCGHIVNGWPAIYRLGEKVPWLPCDECTMQQLAETGRWEGVWVEGEFVSAGASFVRATDPAGEIKATKPKPRKKSPTKKRNPAPWDVWLTNG